MNSIPDAIRSETRGPRGPEGPGPLDAESRDWLGDLRSEGPGRRRALARLYERLLAVARSEAGRRRGRLPERIQGEVDDLCLQAASDATLAVLRKLDTFRGEARFTTWASKFVILELSTRLRRRAWHGRTLRPEEGMWDRLTDSAAGALEGVEHAELLAALRRAVEDDLTERQRLVFRSAVIDEVPIDVLAERLESSRGAIYKVLHDARRKLRASLADAGHLEDPASGGART